MSRFGDFGMMFGGTQSTIDPYWSNVVLLMGFEGTNGSTTMPDESPVARGNASINDGAQISTAQFKFGSSSLRVDGTNDYVYYGDSADWLFSGQFTVECWVRFNSLTPASTVDAFVSHFNAGLNRRSWYLGSWNTTDINGQISTNGSSAAADLTGTWTPSTGVWYHVAMDRDASNVFRIYVDGTMKNSATVSGSLYDSDQNLIIGSANNASNTFDGWIDEVRITKGVARYASNSGYTVPTAAFPRG